MKITKQSIASISDAQLLEELKRRPHLIGLAMRSKRANQGKVGGQGKIERECPECKDILTATEMREHLVKAHGWGWAKARAFRG